MITQLPCLHFACTATFLISFFRVILKRKLNNSDTKNCICKKNLPHMYCTSHKLILKIWFCEIVTVHTIPFLWLGWTWLSITNQRKTELHSLVPNFTISEASGKSSSESRTSSLHLACLRNS